MRYALRLAGAVSLAFVALLSVPRHVRAESSNDAASLVERFDRAVETGLPFTVALPFVLPADGSPRTRRTVHEGIVVERRLAVDLRLGPAIRGKMYAGRLGGNRAVFTRAGDRLDVSMPAEDGVRVVGFRAGLDDVHRRTYLAGEGMVGEPEALPSMAELSIGPNHVEDPLAYHPTFHVFLHNDLRHEDGADLHARFAAWWIEDLLSVLPGEPRITLHYYIRVPWISDMDYERADVLDRFADALRRLAPHLGFPYGRSYKHKFLLLTARPAQAGSSGFALQGQSEAVATVQGRLSVVAHEFGHTMGASHEAASSEPLDASVWGLLPWRWCDSNMHPVAPSAYSCLRYSSENARAIRSYQRHGPTVERPDHWLERR